MLTMNEKTKQLVFSDVIYVPHARNQKPTVFVKITTVSGLDLMMTSDHLIPGRVGEVTILLTCAICHIINFTSLHFTKPFEIPKIHPIHHLDLTLLNPSSLLKP